ncbi:MAG: (Fe-S)-binding protein [Anaerolineae bacterium]
MLTLPERILFILLALVCVGLAARGFYRIYRAVVRGEGRPPLGRLLRRLVPVSLDILLQRPIVRTRPWASFFHTLVFFAFAFYGLVNILDLTEGFLGFSTLHRGGIFSLYNLIADLLSVAGLIGMAALLIRRFGLKPFSFNPGVLLRPEVPRSIPRDSLIVGLFILFHVGSRWLGQAFRVAESGHIDLSQPTASLVAMARGRWLDGWMAEGGLTIGIHVTWWLALGLILLFLPYFPYSKHIHLFIAPLNWILRDEGALGRLDPPTQDGEGASQLEHLRWYQLLDAYACIMCNRCQDVCPAHETGQVLSPAALEINKRYFLNHNLAAFAGGHLNPPPLLEMVIPMEAVWACTTCAACVNICPVGNRPMLDIVDIRRGLVYEGDELDPNLQAVLESFMRQGNSFNKASRRRARWAKKGLDFKIKDARKEPVEYLWFVGDYASFDPRMQENSKTVARLFHQAGLDFGILYNGERNAGNDVRRVGEEGLFEMLVEQNLKAMERAEFKAIVTTDPHSYNTLKNEYGELGLDVPVYHYTEVLADLLASGRLRPALQNGTPVTYHDPCYLGRYNGVTEAPRRILGALEVELREMPRCRENTYCCGAGGGQIWMDTATGERPSEQRIREAATLGEDLRYFVVACPKDMAMYSEAVKTTGYEGRIEVVDIAWLVEGAVHDRGA